MIKAVRETTIKPAATDNPAAGTHIVDSSLLIIAITSDEKHYHLFDNLCDSLGIAVEDKIKHAPDG